MIDGTVKTITDFGAFVDIGGVDALLHISDLAWNKVVHPTEVVNVGDQLKVKVLSADPNTGRITVGLSSSRSIRGSGSRRSTRSAAR